MNIKYFITAACACLALASCGSKDTQPGAALLAEANAAFDRQDYSSAIVLIDSLNSAYPSDIVSRRNSINLKTRAVEQLAVRQLETADSLTVALTIRNDSLMRLLKWVDNPVEGYYTAPKGFTDGIGLRARLDRSGVMTLIAVMPATEKASAVKLTGAHDGSEALSARFAVDGEINRVENGRRTITLIGGQCDTIGAYASRFAGETLTLRTDAGKAVKVLPQAEAAAVALVYEAAATQRNLKVAAIRRQHLEQQLSTARQQVARTEASDSVSAL